MSESRNNRIVEELKEEFRKIAGKKGARAAADFARDQLENSAGYDLTNPSMGLITEAIEDLDNEQPPRKNRYGS